MKIVVKRHLVKASVVFSGVMLDDKKETKVRQR